MSIDPKVALRFRGSTRQLRQVPSRATGSGRSVANATRELATASTIADGARWRERERSSRVPARKRFATLGYTHMVEDSQSCNCAAQSPAPPIYYHDSMAVWDLMSTPPDNHMACWDSSSMTAHARPWNSISNLLPDMPGGFVQLYIGHWGVVTDWEGQALLANLGYLRYVNDCYQETVFSDHITYGVTTLHTETDYRKLPKFFEDTTATVEAKLLMDFIDSVSDQNLLYHPNDWLYQPSHPMTTKNLSILVSGHGYSSLIWTASGSGSEH